MGGETDVVVVDVLVLLAAVPLCGREAATDAAEEVVVAAGAAADVPMVPTAATRLAVEEAAREPRKRRLESAASKASSE